MSRKKSQLTKRKVKAKKTPDVFKTKPIDPIIKLEQFAEIDLAKNVRIENMYAYLDRRFEQASTPLNNKIIGQDSTAEDAVGRIILVATYATKLLEDLVQKFPKRVARYIARTRPNLYPHLENKYPDSILDIIRFSKAPKNKRNDANPVIVKEMERHARHLFISRMNSSPEDDPPCPSNSKTLKTDELKLRSNNIRNIGFNGEVDLPKLSSLLPKISSSEDKAFLKVWWLAEQEILKYKYGTLWYLHEDILRMANKDPNKDAAKAKGNVARQFEKAFKQEVWRLFSNFMQGEIGDDIRE